MPDVIKNLDQFVKRLADDKKLTNLDSEVINQIHIDLKEKLENQLNAVIIANLPPEKLVDFEKKLAEKNDADIQEFISESIPNLDEIFAKELIIFRNTYLNQ